MENLEVLADLFIGRRHGFGFAATTPKSPGPTWWSNNFRAYKT